MYDSHSAQKSLNLRPTENEQRAKALVVARQPPFEANAVETFGFWRTYREMQSDRLLSIAGGVAFFVLLAIFPAITALVSAYALFFNASTIIENLSVLSDVVPGNVLSIVHEQATRIASNSGSALSTGLVVGLLVSLWSAMSGVKAMIDALNVIYEQKESRSFIKAGIARRGARRCRPNRYAGGRTHGPSNDSCSSRVPRCHRGARPSGGSGPFP